jgi:hypothetical protein
VQRSILAVVAGYLTFAAGVRLLLFVSAVDPHTLPSPAFVAGATVYGMAFAALGGLVATRVAGDPTDRHARLVAVLIAGLALVALATQYTRGSFWLELATLLLMAPSTRIGAALGRRAPDPQY